MPKISKRQRVPRHSGYAPNPSHALPDVSVMKVRKVSFEEGSDQASQDKPNSFNTPVRLGPVQLPSRMIPSKAIAHKNMVLERKPITSVSLTELWTMSSSRALDDSPRSVARSSHVSLHEMPAASCSSPWGQFVDVVPDDNSSSFGGSDNTTCRFYSVDETPMAYEGMRSSGTASYHPYRTVSRQPLRIRKSKTCMNGFLLTSPAQSESYTSTHKDGQKGTTPTAVLGVESALEQLRM